MAKRILITGASGFIGSFMAARALSEGLEVWAAVRRSSSRKYLQDPRLRFIELNLSSSSELKAQLGTHLRTHEPFDYVIHAAGATKCRAAKDFFTVNTEGTTRLAATLKETGALAPQGRLVFISTLGVYGPIHEEDRRPIRENDNKKPNTAYGRSKLQAEEGLAKIPGLNYVVLRPTGVYGPRERDYYLMAQSIRRHVDFSVGFKPQFLTFVYVDDLVEAAFRALENGRSGRAYAITDGHSYTSRAFSDLLQQELGVKHVLHVTAPLWLLRGICHANELLAKLTGRIPTLNTDKCRIMSQRNWECDIHPAREELGYVPQWPLARGVKAAVAWYKQEGWL